MEFSKIFVKGLLLRDRRIVSHLGFFDLVILFAIFQLEDAREGLRVEHLRIAKVQLDERLYALRGLFRVNLSSLASRTLG